MKEFKTDDEIVNEFKDKVTMIVYKVYIQDKSVRKRMLNS